MADAAAFFANKKKKKKNKPFSFNANKIDAATVTTTVHVDAPALSTDNQDSVVPASGTNLSGGDFGATNANPAGASTGEQWDDEAYGAGLSTNKVASTATAVELMDMKSLDPKRNDQDNIAEKLRVEETKAQLAAAREGMEREAARIKEEKEKKEQEQGAQSKPGTIAPRFAGAAANLGGGGGGGKWVPPHLRGGGGGAPGATMGGVSEGLSRVKLGGSQALDTQDETLFPDLALADKIVEKQKQQPAAYMAPKKTAVGGGASWASKPAQPKQSASGSAPATPWSKKKAAENAAAEAAAAPPAPAPVPAPETAPEPAPAAAPSAAPAPAPAAPAKPLVKKPKKKKKDLSTFKPTG